jgi:general secretion pathway protein D
MKMKRIRRQIAVMLVGLLLLSGCEHLDPTSPTKYQLDEDAYVVDKKANEETAAYRAESGEDPLKRETAQPLVLNQGTGDFVGTIKKSQKPRLPSATGKFTLNFEEAELGEVVKVIINDTLNESYVINPKVRGKVTLQTSRPLTREELLPTLELLLQVNNAVLLKKGGIYQIEPAANALVGSGSVPITPGMGGNLPPGYQIHIIPLRFVGVTEMESIIKPMTSPAALLRVDVARNLLMVAGTEQELRGIKETINIFDVDYLQGMSFGMFPLNNVDAATVAQELEEIFELSADSPLAGMFKIVPIERLNSLLVLTPQPRYLNKAKLWISRLDKANTSASGGVIVYRVQNMKAVDLAATLNDIFISGKKKTKKVSLAPGLKAVKISSKDKKNQGNRTKQIRSVSADVGDVRIIADERNNSIIIVATAQEYENIRTVIKQLDAIPLQVLIEARILAVRLDDNLRYGVEWKFKNSLGSNREGLGQLGPLIDAGLGASTGGFSYLVKKADNIEAIIHARAEKKNIKVLSSPSLMVLNNQEARIQVGDQVPIRTSESLNTSGGANPIQTSNIEMRDTGVTLKVTPRVNAGGMVIMDIEQSVDTASQTNTSQIDSPTILQRSLNSTVAIHSGETVVLGGLISETYDETRTGIPWLMDIPYLGAAFSTTSRVKVRDELIVLITPQVITEMVDAKDVTREYKRKMTTIFEDISRMNDSPGTVEQGVNP